MGWRDFTSANWRFFTAVLVLLKVIRPSSTASSFPLLPLTLWRTFRLLLHFQVAVELVYSIVFWIRFFFLTSRRLHISPILIFTPLFPSFFLLFFFHFFFFFRPLLFTFYSHLWNRDTPFFFFEHDCVRKNLSCVYLSFTSISGFYFSLRQSFSFVSKARYFLFFFFWLYSLHIWRAEQDC